MDLFLSYASEDRPRAGEIALALRADQRDVFFDRVSLVGGENYHGVIGDQIAKADLFIFLISPHSVEAGSYPSRLSLGSRVGRQGNNARHDPFSHLGPLAGRARGVELSTAGHGGVTGAYGE